jgi:uncharacterized repeat protein (TIGR03803 family)
MHPRTGLGLAILLAASVVGVSLFPRAAGPNTLKTGYVASVLYSFLGGTDGAYPYAGVISDRSDALYGTTQFGGAYGAGTVFKLTPIGAAYTESVIYSFRGGSDGAQPVAGVIMDRSGALYGTTYIGGSGGVGTVFKLTPSGTRYAETVIHDFQNGRADGAYPLGGVIADGAGAVYGTTQHGGAYLDGTVFKLTPSSTGYVETIIHSQSPTDGAEPPAGLTMDAAGALYYTTSGANGIATVGTVVKLTPAASGYSESVIYRFTGKNGDGAFPAGRLFVDATGAVYGTTPYYGANGWGTFFKLAPSGSGYTESVSDGFLGGADGENPVARVVADQTGTLYGTTASGGNGGRYGTVFEEVPGAKGSYLESVIHTFVWSDGAIPTADLIIDKAGTLFGTTQFGGSAGYGTVFALGSGPARATQPVHKSRAVATRKTSAPASEGHVYVLRDTPGAREGTDHGVLFRFPIVGGVVSSLPDSILTTGPYIPFAYPCGAAVAGDGRQYVSAGTQFIDVFAPGAHGNDPPIQQLTVGGGAHFACLLAISKRGYLFAQANFYGVNVFAPDGHFIRSIKRFVGIELAVDPQGNVYDGDGTTIDVFATPVRFPKLVRSLCVSTAGSAGDLAVSERGDLFISRKHSITRVPDTTTLCPLPPAQFTIYVPSRPGLQPTSLAVAHDHLFVIAGRTELLQLDPNKRGQEPIADIHFPHDLATTVAVGP